MNASAGATERTFDPSRYLTKITRRVRDGSGGWAAGESDYLEVKWRLLWLRTEHPDSIIETELVSHPEGLAIFRAKVTLASGGSATGWGHESAGGFEDYLEKAETKALGRALAALGFGTQFCEDFDVAASDEADSGRPSSGDAEAGMQRGPRATEPQVRAIYAIARGALALNEEELDERCRERYRVGPSDLSRRQASEFIDVLKNGAAGSLN
jgi:hypothetical protein